ncbi:hypothetical protein BCR39DRAFT_570042 [Naematelia encephala]|uniref:Uncharacterized protein n=1 Tax=Naematelia encephala TaxID=71784 RepID=A0A1Y2AFQ2_9TREE|nr:hypothetical protein BCR39DRAFT_570042 [Naematelia encephala]
MPNENSSHAEWADTHTTALVRGMISTILSNRIDFRSIPDLEPVGNNGGDRINKKLIQILTRMADQYPGCQGAVKELVAVTGRKRKESNTPSPTKQRNSSETTPSPTKKRKDNDTPSPTKKVKEVKKKQKKGVVVKAEDEDSEVSDAA